MEQSADLSQKVLTRSDNPFLFREKDEIEKEISQKSKDGERAKERIHFNYSFPNSNGEISVVARLEGERQHRKIEEITYWTNVKGAPLAFLDALFELSTGKTLSEISFLRFKEIESYLRDRNDIPAFPNSGASLIRYFEVLVKLKEAMAGKGPERPMVLPTSSERSSPSLDDYLPHSVLLFDHDNLGEFVDLNSDLKLAIVRDIFDCHVRPYLQRDGGDVECVHVMDNLVVIEFMGSCGTCSMSMTTTMDYIKHVLRTELYDSSLDLITDS